MLFSEKMANIPQPHRAELWKEYRTLCTALALNIRLKKEDRAPTEQELEPLREAARKANKLLETFSFSPSFFPESADFFLLLTEELSAIAAAPSQQD